MAILGIDYGLKRIGLAVSDPMNLFAHPVETLRRDPEEILLRELKKTIQKREVTEIVVGLPIHMNGSKGEKAEEVLHFVEWLKERVNLPIVTWDERLTSRQAESLMLEADLSRKRRRLFSDRLAAQILLQSYLDRFPPHPLAGAGPLPEADSPQAKPSAEKNEKMKK